MNVDQAYKQFLMEQARKHFEKVSEAVADALCEEDKMITIRQYDPSEIEGKDRKELTWTAYALEIDPKVDNTCISCSHFKDCPIILAWVQATGQPMEALSFSCSEYKRQEMPNG